MSTMLSRTLLAICLLQLHPALAQEYQGAAKLLDRIRAEQDAAGTPITALRKKLDAFSEEAHTLASDVAARRWLELYDDFTALPGDVFRSQGYGDRLDYRRLIQALPPSEAWEGIGVHAAERLSRKADGENVALGLLVAMLLGKTDDSGELLKNVETQLEIHGSPGNYSGMRRAASMRSLSAALDLRAGKRADPLPVFMRELELCESGMEDSSGNLSVPKLPEGDPETETLLTRVLKLKAAVYFEDDETRKRAVLIVMKDPSILKVPMWELVGSPDDAGVYQVMVDRFPEREGDSSAARYSLLARIDGEDLPDAYDFFFNLLVADTGSTRSIPLSGIEDPEFKKKMTAFVSNLLTKFPYLDLWSQFAFIKEPDGGVPPEMIRAALAKIPANCAAHHSLLTLQLQEHFNRGEISASVEEMRKFIEVEPPAHDAAESVDSIESDIRKGLGELGVKATPGIIAKLSEFREPQRDLRKWKIDLALNIARIGRLENKPEWTSVGLDTAISLHSASNWREDISELVDELLLNGRGIEAERLIVEAFIPHAKSKDLYVSRPDHYMNMLFDVYMKAGKPEEIVRLLDEGEFWGVGDAADFGRYTTLPLRAAQALFAVGKREPALQLAKRVLSVDPGVDAVYQLILDVNPPDLEDYLDSVHRLNRFEERPLVWKAKFQLNQGRVDEAEKTIRAAIEIDPSDGEQGKGDRMRAYEILGAILERKGDTEQAALMKEVIRAIRISEVADEYREAGLMKRSIEMYQEALGHFADAYCIQSRLALVYNAAGDVANAEKHFARAFELMPSSFGRVESHCFGCEGTFTGKASQGIAERVFTRLTEEMPDRAQVFYLMGYLRASQGRHAEALAAFRRAVELDPDYLNAWKKILESTEKSGSPASETEDASLAVLRLQREVPREGFVNLPRLWDAILESERSIPYDQTGPVYRLAASTPTFSGSRSSRLKGGKNLKEDFTSSTMMREVIEVMETITGR